MPCNESKADRIARAIIVAPLLVLASWALGFGSVAGVIALVLAAVMLLTAAVGFCPLYTVFGINTCKRPAS